VLTELKGTSVQFFDVTLSTVESLPRAANRLAATPSASSKPRWPEREQKPMEGQSWRLLETADGGNRPAAEQDLEVECGRTKTPR
jgi:hypothetical protein